MSVNNLCPKGHEVESGDQFCGVCGARTFQNLDAVELEPEIQAEVAPTEHDSPSDSTSPGLVHANEATSVPPEWTPALPNSQSGRNRGALIALSVAGVLVIALVIGAIVSGSSSSTSSSNDVSATTVDSAQSLQSECESNFTGWTIALAADSISGGSGLGPVLVFGSQSAITQTIEQAESEYVSMVFQQGRASALAWLEGASSRACSAMAQDSPATLQELASNPPQ